MKSRVARLTLLILFIVSLGATAYLFWAGESHAASEAAALRTFDEKARATTRALLDTRAAQQAYVAEGQAGEFWPGKVAQGVTTVRSSIAALRESATSTQARDELDAAIATLDDFAQMDRRAREYTRTGQHLLASDLIFGDGLEMTGAIDARLAQARAAETATADEAVSTFRSRQAFALTAGAAAATLVVLLLLPAGDSTRTAPALAAAADRAAQPIFPARPHTPEPAIRTSEEAELPEGTPDLQIEQEARSRLPMRPGIREAEPAAQPVSAAPVEAEPAAAFGQIAQPATDFRGLASLCTDLARVIDTQELPSLLDRASMLLDARGIILWISDPDGRELNPIVAHGYPAQLVNRLGTIDRDAENATAAAFRTALLQTVKADAESNGAIVAPLVTPAGCVGVMAAELRRDGERDESRLAAAAIVAAQLATLVGPPVRTQGHSEVANA
jgi:cbb3-type cytochrome oxidase subunit 3